VKEEEENKSSAIAARITKFLSFGRRGPLHACHQESCKGTEK